MPRNDYDEYDEFDEFVECEECIGCGECEEYEDDDVGPVDSEPVECEDDPLAILERKVGYIFSDRSILESAMTHASGADHRLASNERMEFLGDAVLGLIVCEMLYDRYPDRSEGDLTQIKSSVVSRQTCAVMSERLGLGDFLVLGKGMSNNPSVPRSILANTFEAILAAIYFDGGFEAAQRFVHHVFDEEIRRVGAGEHGINFKSLLQQTSQRKFSTTPAYKSLDEKGPDHSKCFNIGVKIGNRRFTPAWGPNKKEAEQRAAENALAELKGEEPPYPSE